MKARGIIWEGRQFRGSVDPPASWEDTCRFGHDGVFTNAPVWTKLPSGLWYLDFVAASSQLVTIGGIGAAKSLAFWLNPDSNAESILEEVDNTGPSIAAGAMQYASWDNCFVNGVDTDTVVEEVWSFIVLTSTSAVDMSAFRLGLVNVTYLDGGIAGVAAYSYEVDNALIRASYNKQRRLFGV